MKSLGEGVNEVLAACRQEIELLETRIWAGELSSLCAPRDAALAELEALKAEAVAKANELLERRHAWRERLRARACRERRQPFIPRPRHPSAEELAETLTGQCPAPAEATAYFRGALARRPFELWPRPEDEAGDWSDFPEQQQENR